MTYIKYGSNKKLIEALRPRVEATDKPCLTLFEFTGAHDRNYKREQLLREEYYLEKIIASEFKKPVEIKKCLIVFNDHGIINSPLNENIDYLLEGNVQNITKHVVENAEDFFDDTNLGKRKKFQKKLYDKVLLMNYTKPKEEGLGGKELEIYLKQVMNVELGRRGHEPYSIRRNLEYFNSAGMLKGEIDTMVIARKSAIDSLVKCLTDKYGFVNKKPAVAEGE